MSEVKHQKWKTKKENRISAKTKKEITVQITCKEETAMTINDVKKDFQSNMLVDFMAHIQRINRQFNATKCIKEALSETEIFILMEWRENYDCKFAEEPQAVHFGASREQVSLHTGMFYAQNFSQGFCTFSKDLRHDCAAILAHLNLVMEHI